jgi:hypothetical protein
VPGLFYEDRFMKTGRLDWRPAWLRLMDLFQPASGLPEIGNKSGGSRNKSRLKRIVSM